MITGYASIKGAVEAIKQGASDYITKPFQKEEILLATEKVLEKRRLLDEINYLRNQLSNRYSFANIVSRNRVMHEIFESIEVLAQNDATVLITGEPDGQGAVARAVHSGQAQVGSVRRHQLCRVPRHPPRERALRLRARRLHRCGARPGRQDRALDLRHALPRRNREHHAQHAAQALARTRRARGRATRRQPQGQGQHARDRGDQRRAERARRGRPDAEDFFYRINVVPIRIPPLRDRIEDIPLLVSEFLRNSEMARTRHHPRVQQGAVRAHGLPLARQRPRARQRAERAILRTTGPVIREVDLPGAGKRKDVDSLRRTYDYEVPLKEYLRRAEKDYLSHVLKKNRGSINLSAKHALVDAATLHRKMKLHTLQREDFRGRDRGEPDQALVG